MSNPIEPIADIFSVLRITQSQLDEISDELTGQQPIRPSLIEKLKNYWKQLEDPVDNRILNTLLQLGDLDGGRGRDILSEYKRLVAVCGEDMPQIRDDLIESTKDGDKAVFWTIKATLKGYTLGVARSARETITDIASATDLNLPANLKSMEPSECRVYSKFTATRPDGSTVNLRIQDMPPECQETVMDLFINVYAKEEMIYKSSGVYYTEESRAEILQLLQHVHEILPTHTDVCCVDGGADDGKVVGAAMMYLAEGIFDLSMFQVETEQCKKLLEIGINSLYRYDVVKEQKVDKYYEDLGIVVHPNYRRLGIAKEFVKARRLICKLEKVPMTAAWMTAVGTQRAGESDGWHTVVEHQFDDLAKRFSVKFDDTPPTCKYMLTRVEL